MKQPDNTNKKAFDPNKPFEVVNDTKPVFDPNKPFDVVEQPETPLVVNPEKEIQEKEIEKSAYDAGLIPALKPFTPETFVAKQDNMQQFVDNKNVLDAGAYFTQKAVEDENKRQEQIAINAQKLGLEPEFLNRVIDINKAAHPIFNERKQQEDYLLGSLGSFNEGLAEVFRTFDRASTMMADAVGLEWKNPVFKTFSESLSRVGAEGAYKVPDNVVGNVMGGMAGMAPDLMMTYFMPEMKLTQMSRLTGGALTKIPKFPTWLGAKQGLQAYSQSGESADRYKEFFSGAQHGFTEGLTYEALGLTGAQAGKLAEALGAGKLLTETTAGVANGTLFGTHGALMNSEFLQTGEIDPKQFFTDFGMGFAFHGKKIGEEVVNLATVNQSMLRKAHASFWTSNRDLIRTGFVSPKSQFQLRRESQDLWDKAMKAESPAEKNQYLMAKTAVDNIISSRAYAVMVGSNPQRFKDAIKNDPNLGDKEKETMLRRIEETAEDFKTTIEEGNRGTNIAPEFEKFTETAKKKSEESLASKQNIDNLRVNVQLTSDFFEGAPIREKSFGSLDSSGRKEMESLMLSMSDNSKILDAVISLVPVDVMNDITGGNRSPREFFNDKAMLKDALSSDSKKLVFSRFFESIMDATSGTVIRDLNLGRIPEKLRSTGIASDKDFVAHDKTFGQKGTIKKGELPTNETKNKQDVADLEGKTSSEKISNLPKGEASAEAGGKKITVYRGEGGGVFQEKGVNEGFTWVAKEESTAKNYGTAKSMEVTEPQNPLELPYKFNTEVRASNITNNIRELIKQQFKSGKITTEQMRELLDKTDKFEKAAGENLEPWHTKINKAESSKEFADIVKTLGYDSLLIYEGKNKTEPTFGLLKEKEVKYAEEVAQKAGEPVQEKGAEGGAAKQGGLRNDGKDRKGEKEVTPKTDKDGIDGNGDGRNVPSGRIQVQEQQVQKPDAEKPSEKTVGKTEPGVEAKDKTGAEKVSKSEKVEISDGKIKEKKDFMADVADEVSRKAIQGKSKRIVEDKQKQMDSEWKESEKKKNKSMDKGVDVEIYDEATRETKQYRVKKKADGSYVISSYSEKDAKGRPKPLSRAEKDSGKIPGIRKKIMEEYRKKREQELAKEKSALEERYIKETDAEITNTAKEYLAQRKQEAPQKAEEFQKEDSGEFPEKPTISEGGKKQRPKLPSEGSKVTLEEMSGLRSEIQKWTRRAREERKETDAEFEATSKSIAEKLKTAADNNQITKGQYRTIVDRIGKARTEKRRKKLEEYVDKVLFGSEYKGQLKAAGKIISAVKKANKKDKSRFGDAYQRAVDFSNIDPKQLTLDELKSFNDIGKKILAVKKVPNVEYLDAALAKFGDKTKEEYDRFENRIEKAKKKGTLDKEISKIEKEFNDYIDEADALFSDIKTAADYIVGQQKLNAARRRINKLLSEELITEEQARVYEQKLGKLEESQGKWEEKLEAFKKDYAESVFKSFSDRETKFFVDELPAPEQRAFRELFAAKKEWIEQMPVRDLMALEAVVNNIRIGEVTPEAYALKNRIEVMRKRSSDVDASINNMMNAKAWQRLQKQQFNNFNKWIAKKVLFLSKAAKSTERDLRNAIILFASTDKYRIDHLLGNMSKKNSFYSQYLDVVKGLQSEANIKTEFSKRREKIFDDFVSSYKKFAGLVTLKEAETQRKKIGNFLIERRYQNLPAFKNGEVTKDNASRVEMGLTVREGEAAKGDNTIFQRDRKLWNDQVAEAKANGLTKEIDGVDVIDVAKYEAWLRKDKATAKLIDEYDTYLKDMESYAKAATMENGRTFIESEKYSPYVKKNRGGEVEPESVLKEVQQGDYVPRMQAGATYSLRGSRDWLENDIFKIMEDHSNDVFRNYFVKPQVVNSLRALKESFKVKEAEIKENQADLNSVQTIRDALMIDMKDAVQRYYNSGKYAFELNKWHDKWLKGAKKGMLLHPARIPSELISNVTRGTLSTGFIPKEQLFMSKADKEAHGSLFEQYIGDKYWSAYSPEISGYSTKRKWRRAVEDVADNFVMFSDKAVGVPLFRTQFSKLFTEITGEKFDAKEYSSNPEYYTKNREAIDKSAAWATRRVEELFNAKTTLSSAQMVKFMGNTVSFNSKDFWTRLLNTLQSFGRNEVEQLRVSGKRLASGDNEQIAMGLRDISSIVISNALYGILRTGLGVAFAQLGKDALESIGVDAPELTDYEKEQADNLLKKDKIVKDLKRNEVSLMMGGSANIYSFASRVGMYALQDVLNEEQQEEVYSFMSDYMYSQKIPEYGKPETILKAVAPVPSPAIGDLFDTAESFENMILAIEKSAEGDNISEKEVYEIFNLINLTMKYGMPNPVSPSVQRMLNRKIRELDNKGTFSGDNKPLSRPDRQRTGATRGRNAPLSKPNR